MRMVDMKNNQPIIIGLAGKAGSGKTSVAEHIVPKGSIEVTKLGLKWDHIFYGLPLYEMASIKRNIEGFNQKNRKMYAIHNALYDLYGGVALGEIPDYDVMFSMVKEIYEMEIEPRYLKPRSFLQTAGDICRKHSPDCFAKWAIMKSSKIYRNYVRDLPEDSEPNPMAVIISDVRYKNEAEHILKQPNGFVVCYEADQQTLNERLLKRDGKLMSEEHSSHPSENGIEEVKKIASAIINTDNMTLEEQAEETLKKLGITEELLNA